MLGIRSTREHNIRSNPRPIEHMTTTMQVLSVLYKHAAAPVPIWLASCHTVQSSSHIKHGEASEGGKKKDPVHQTTMVSGREEIHRTGKARRIILTMCRDAGSSGLIDCLTFSRRRGANLGSANVRAPASVRAHICACGDMWA